jgi:integrase
MATIRERNGRWQCIIKRKGYPLQSKTFMQRKDAERWGRLQERLIDSGQWIDRTEAEQTIFAELLERYAKEVSTRKRGYSVELVRIEMLKRAAFAQYSVAAITSKLIATWRDSRLMAVAPSTVAREMQLLSHVFSIATREWGFGLHFNPILAVKKPASPSHRDRTLKDHERDQLLQACGACRSSWVKPVVIFALETAARRGEILSLRWTDIDLSEATAKLRITKSGLPRTIPLSPACISMLKSLPHSITGEVFPITTEALKQAYGRAVLRAGITDFTFHDLRHDALTRLAKQGFSVLELRAISGHANANMLQRYVSVDASELAQKLARV